MTTPARRQYLRIKKEHKDEILLFRMGDFYETFDDDARTISRELEIALTSRGMGRGKKIPLAGTGSRALSAQAGDLRQRAEPRARHEPGRGPQGRARPLGV